MTLIALREENKMQSYKYLIIIYDFLLSIRIFPYYLDFHNVSAEGILKETDYQKFRFATFSETNLVQGFRFSIIHTMYGFSKTKISYVIQTFPCSNDTIVEFHFG